jgi:hypothetical protein
MAEPTFTLTQQEYEALIALARNGTKTSDGQVDEEKARRLDAFLKSLEKKNNIVRDAVWVQWQESDQPLPPTTAFPEKWPPEMRFYIELISRKVAKVDVEAVIETHARQPVNVLVTRDPGARVGWTPVDDFFQN